MRFFIFFIWMLNYCCATTDDFSQKINFSGFKFSLDKTIEETRFENAILAEKIATFNDYLKQYNEEKFKEAEKKINDEEERLFTLLSSTSLDRQPEILLHAEKFEKDMEKYLDALSFSVNSMQKIINDFFDLFEFVNNNLDNLERCLTQTDSIDIGGIRIPEEGSVFTLSNPGDITINRSMIAFPDFLFPNALNFGKLLKTFPEFKNLKLKRTHPLSCLISHVGINIFDDFLADKLKTPICSFETMIRRKNILINHLPEFISDFASFLEIFKGGVFTYRTFKCPFYEFIEGGYLLLNRNIEFEEVGTYAYSHRAGNKITNYQVPLHIIPEGGYQCPHQTLFHSMIVDILGIAEVKSVLKCINHTGGESLYFETTFFIPYDFEACKIEISNLDTLRRSFLSR